MAVKVKKQTKKAKQLVSTPRKIGGKISNPVKVVKEKIRHNRQQSLHRTARLTRRSEVPRLGALPAWWKLLYRSAQLMVRQWKQFSLLILFVTLLTWLINGVYSLTIINSLKDIFASGGDAFSTFEQTTLTVSSLVSSLFSSNSATDTGPDILKTALCVFSWLIVLWISRYAVAKKVTTLREALYKSGTAFVPTLFVGSVILLELIPAIIALFFASSIFGTGFLEGIAEKLLFSVFAILLLILSTYLLASSIVALPIVGLPGTYPWEALVNAKRLVAGRRAQVVRKALAFIIAISLAWIVTFIPFVLLDNMLFCPNASVCWSSLTLVPFAFYFLATTAICLAAVSYYMLYRTLLSEDDI